MDQALLLAYILSSVTINGFAQIVWKKGAKIEKLSIKGIIKMLLNKKIIIGLAMYFISALLWILVLSNTELSYAFPFISLGYILVAILSKLVLKEEITPKRVLGMVIITAGVIMVGCSL